MEIHLLTIKCQSSLLSLQLSRQRRNYMTIIKWGMSPGKTLKTASASSKEIHQLLFKRNLVIGFRGKFIDGCGLKATS